MILFPTGVQGLSDTKWQGAQGQVHRMVGVDYQSKPGIIKVQQKLTKDSGSTVTELCKVSVPVSDGSTLWFSSESGKIWREVAGVYTLVTTLTIPGYNFKLSTAEDTGNLKNVTTQVNIPTGMFFKPDGLIMYIICNATVSGNSGEIFQYTLTTAFDVSTATYASKTKAADAQGYSMAISSDGTKLFVAEDSGGTSVITYTMSTPWDISTAGAAGTSFSFAATGSRAFGLSFNSTGTKMVIFDGGTYEVNQYDLSVAWDVSTATFATTLDVDSFTSGCMSPDGFRMYIQTSISNGLITEYLLGTAFDVSTAIVTGTTFEAGSGRYFAITAAPDNSGFYTATQGTTIVYQYSLVTAAADLNVTPLSAEEYSVPAINAEEDDLPTPYIYFTTESWLLRIPVSKIATDWTPELDYDYITLFTYGDDTYHPIRKQNNRLFIGDKYVLAEVNEAGVVTLETDFNVLAPEQITSLGIIDTDLLVGTKEPRKAWVKRWDTEALSWYAQDSVEETEIYAFLQDDNDVYVIAGDYGKMYYYDGEKMHPDVRVPGEYSKTARSKVNHNAVASFFGIPLFGVSNLEGNPSWQGVYSYGRFSKDYNVTLNFPFPLSSDEFSGIEIGSILVQGYDLMVSWKSGTSVGVDRIDWTLKYESAFIETMVLLGAKDRSKFKSMDVMIADYYSLPEYDADTKALEFSVENNYQGFNDIETQQVLDEKLYQMRAKSTQKELGAVAVMIEFNVNENEGPEVENFHVNFAGEQP